MSEVDQVGGVHDINQSAGIPVDREAIIVGLDEIECLRDSTIKVPLIMTSYGYGCLIGKLKCALFMRPQKTNFQLYITSRIIWYGWSHKINIFHLSKSSALLWRHNEWYWNRSLILDLESNLSCRPTRFCPVLYYDGRNRQAALSRSGREYDSN